MQDEVRDRSVALVINVGQKGGRLTAELLKAAMRDFLKKSQEHKIHHGKQTVRQLISQDAGAQSIEITEKNIKSFERIARKYGVDFALKKDRSEGKYLVFFKSRDADAINAAFSEYANKSLKRKRGKPSLAAQLEHFKELAKNSQRDMEKHREKGSMER